MDWSLYLSSYAPLLGIFALRLSKSHVDAAFWCSVLTAAIVLNLLFLLNYRLGPRDVKIGTVHRSTSEVAAYMATYLLPFLTASDLDARDLTAYGLLVWFVGLIMTRDGALHVNPLLALFGWRLVTIETVDRGFFYLLTRQRSLAEGTVVTAIQLRSRLLMER